MSAASDPVIEVHDGWDGWDEVTREVDLGEYIRLLSGSDVETPSEEVSS